MLLETKEPSGVVCSLSFCQPAKSRQQRDEVFGRDCCQECKQAIRGSAAYLRHPIIESSGQARKTLWLTKFDASGDGCFPDVARVVVCPLAQLRGIVAGGDCVQRYPQRHSVPRVKVNRILRYFAWRSCAEEFGQ
ncbi:hypothetical protein CJO85_00650 [Ralstonia solanacearum]|nr:hypothetical protein CJO85_00650 [Ralstonia solanacearum]